MKGLTAGRRMNLVFAAIIALLIAGIFLINAIALVLSNRYTLSVDLTANAAYEIGAETKAVLDALTKDVAIDVLSAESGFGGDPYLVQAKHILQRYPQYSGRVTLRFIDYSADPSFAAAHPDLSLSDGDILVSCGARVKQLKLSRLFNYAYDAAGGITVQSSRAEEAVTAAILYVLSEKDVHVGVVYGHGEQETGNFTALLVNNNFTLKKAILATDDVGSFDMLLITAPQTDFSEDDIRALDSFLSSGGQFGKTVFYTASVTQAPLPNLETFLSEWGLSLGEGVVFETKAERTYQYQPYYPIANIVSDSYREQLIDAQTPMLMPLSRPMRLLFASRDGYYTETLLQFASTAAVRPADAGDGFKAADAAGYGPMPALALLTRRVTDGGGTRQSNLVVSASTEMLSELSLQNSSLANAELLLNLTNALTERGDAISIAPKSLAGKTLGINSRQVTTLGVLLGGILPLAILLAGVGVWLYRRHL